jgi:general secretion pathway protein C
MDVATRLAGFRQQSPEEWAKSANRVLPPVAVGILVIAIAYQAATLTWTALSSPGLDGPPPSVIVRSQVETAPAPGASYEPLRGWRPFGEPPAEAEARTAAISTLLDAPDTTLNLELHGVNAFAEPDQGNAMISSGRAEQKLYFAGDTIDGASGARLHSVFFDRVLLDRGGRLETLRLPLELAATAQPPAPMGALDNQGGQQAGGSIRDVISDNAAQFTEIIRPVPHMEGGQMVGFRLTPGRDRESFAALGLEPGDVLTEVNGMVLNNPQAAGQVFTALGEAQMANVTVLRGGSPQVLVIDMSRIESLMENRQ